jgi:GNAT superfamily N-acetyltransferase
MHGGLVSDRWTRHDVRLVDYKAHHHESFRALNLAWITKYFAVEDADRKALDDPVHNILDPGGAIFMAEVDGEPVGTCALMKCPDGAYELAKMAVAPSAQGRGVGRALGEAAITRARSLGAPHVELLSNTVLAPALTLYRSLGFVEVPLPKTDYRRANIKMVLELSAPDPRNGTRI